MKNHARVNQQKFALCYPVFGQVVSSLPVKLRSAHIVRWYKVDIAR